MKLIGRQKGYTTYTVEIDERDLDRLESGIKMQLDRYPNSDPLIDLLFELRKIREGRV